MLCLPCFPTVTTVTIVKDLESAGMCSILHHQLMMFYEHVVSVSSHHMQPDVLTRISAHLSVVPCCDRKFKITAHGSKNRDAVTLWVAKPKSVAEDLLSDMTGLNGNSALQASIATYQKPGQFRKVSCEHL